MKKNKSFDSLSPLSSDSEKINYQLYNENNVYVKKSDIQNILKKNILINMYQLQMMNLTLI